MSFPARKKQNEINRGPESLVTLVDPRSAAAEAYRALRTNIQFSRVEKPIRTLLLTSTRPDEDKSLTIANLAITFAQMGSRVILVDADLHRPTLHTLFGTNNEQGLTTSLFNASNKGRLKAVGFNERPNIPLQQAGLPNLRLLTSGPLPPNPAELLSSAFMGELIERLQDDADYVLFDAPPILAATDAAVLATKVDGVIIALKAGKVSRDDAREAKEQLEKVHANILGIVLNNARQIGTQYNY